VGDIGSGACFLGDLTPWPAGGPAGKMFVGGGGPAPDANWALISGLSGEIIDLWGGVSLDGQGLLGVGRQFHSRYFLISRGICRLLRRMDRHPDPNVAFEVPFQSFPAPDVVWMGVYRRILAGEREADPLIDLHHRRNSYRY